jgi:DNA-binding XRE family transcriptional regulator
MPDQSQQATLMDLRTRARLTRREMANALGSTERTINVWEPSDSPVKMTVAQEQTLLEGLGCTLDELAIATQQ